MMSKLDTMTVGEAMDEFIEHLRIEIADGTLTKDEEELLLKLLDAPRGEKLTQAQRDQPFVEFVAECLRKQNEH